MVDYVAVLALVVAGWAAVVARSQLRLQEDASGGRGLSFIVSRLMHSEDRRHGVLTTTDSYRVVVELHGPGVMHELALHLERNGRQLDPWEPGFAKHPPIVKRMTSSDERIVWEFDISPAAASSDLWCVLSWVDPRGEHLWSQAYAVQLTEPDELYEWRYYRTRLLRKHLQRLNARTKPLGRWRAHVNAGVDVGNGPFDLGHAPDAPRKVRRRALPTTEDDDY